MSVINKSLELAQLLNQANIRWGFGGSCLLYYLGLEVQPRDLDVVIAIKDVENAREALEMAGARLLEEKPSDNVFLTKKFYTFDWGGIEVDFMASPGIRTEEMEYHLNFDEEGPWKSLEVEGITLCLSDPNQWLVYYGLMKGREKRVSMLKSYLETC